MLSPRSLLGPAAVALLLAAPGCQPGRPAVVPVCGRVYYHNVPLAGGTVIFTPDPDRGGSGPLAQADISPDGRYVLKSPDGPGAAPGWYRVTVVAVRPDPASGPDPGRPRSLLPSRYRDPDLSGLSFQVKDGGENEYDFNLE